MARTDAIPLVDLRAQYAAIKPAIDEAVASVIAESVFVGGVRVTAFEKRFAERCGVRHAVGCSSGSAALHLALLAAGVGPGDEVIVPAMTFVATAEAVAHTGATIVFVDSEPDTLCIDAVAVRRAITPRTKALLPVHLFGQCCDIDALLALARDQRLELIEDAAQAFLATHGTGRAGSFGRFGCFSLYPAKNLGAYGDGGVVVTQNAADAARLRLLADHGRTTKEEHQLVGYNYRLDALQAAVCSVKLDHIEAWTRARQELARRYDDGLANLPVAPLARRRGHVYNVYVVQAPDRDALATHLAERGIRTAVHYPMPLHQQPAFCRTHAGLSLSVAERAAGRVLSLPLYPELSREQQDRVVAAIREFYA